MFVGSVSDNFDERIEQKNISRWNCCDNDKVATETKSLWKDTANLIFVNEQEDSLKQEYW